LSNTAGNDNTAAGFEALSQNTTGANNTANGSQALLSNTMGNFNTATGVSALASNTTAADNTATGFHALLANDLGEGNTATGSNALANNVDGNHNTAGGAGALSASTGEGNTAVGFAALLGSTTGVGNTALGVTAGLNVVTASNVICIGAAGQDVSNSCFIGRIFGQTSSGGSAVFINSAGKLGTSTSSRRFKQQIKPMESTSELLFKLKPVTFRYNNEIDPAGLSQFGLVAEDVEQVNADLVVRDEQGKPYSVRYDQVNAMLLNEFLKEHATVQELKKEIAALKAGLQKVSAQIDLGTRPLQTVVNNH
jgi:hypothetical protein